MYKYNGRIKIKFFPTDEKLFLKKRFETSGTTEFIETFKRHFGGIKTETSTSSTDAETDLFKKAGLQFIPLFLRETYGIIDTSRHHKLLEVIKPEE